MSSPKHQSWKQASSTSEGPNRSGRWLLTIIAIGMLAVLLPKLRQLLYEKTMPTQVVVMQSGRYRSGLRSLPHSKNDLLPLKNLDWNYLNYDDKSDLLQLSRSLSELGSTDVGEGGTLIFYICAHAVTNVSEPGSADILCRDYDLRAPDKGVYPLSEILAEVKKCQATTKLLVLDTGSIISDPRMGMLANDFPSRVRDTLMDWGDPDLWVMLSHSNFQANLVNGANESLFGKSFVDGLVGKANLDLYGGDSGRYVELSELYRYVVARCAAISGGLQQPVLLHGDGKIENIADVPDLRLLTLTKAQKDKAEESNENSNPDEAEGKKPGKPANGRHVAADATPSQEEPNESVQPEVESEGEPEDLLLQAWRVRDQIEGVTVGAGWTPLEFAPHLWRRLLNYLIAFDGQRALEDVDAEADLRRHVDGMRELVSLLQDPSQAALNDRGGLVVHDLARATRSYLGSAARAGFERDSEELRPVADSVRRVRRIQFQMSHFVRWHAEAALCGVAEDAVASRIDPLLVKLAEFERDYESVCEENSRLIELNLSKTERALTQSYDDLIRYLRQHVSAVCNSREKEQPAALAARTHLQAQALLAGPLPTADERRELQEVVAAFDLSPDPSREQVLRMDLPPATGEDRQRQLEMQLQIEQGLIRFVDSSWQPISLDAGLFRTGSTLQNHYLNAAQQLQNSDADLRWLASVDGRDAKQIGWRNQLAWKLGIDAPQKQPSLVVTTDPARLLELSIRNAEEVKIRVSSKTPSAIRGQISIESHDPRISLRWDRDRFLLGEPEDLILRVAVKPQYAHVHQLIKPLKITATLDGYVPFTKELPTRLTGPDRVQLVVHQAGRSQESRVNKRDGIELNTFPNRVTPFKFSVRNFSAKEKTIVATLYQVPLELANSLAPGRLFDGRGQVLKRVQQVTINRDDLTQIASSKPLTLAGGADKSRLDFSPPPPQPPDEGERKPETEKKVVAVKPAKIDISHGMLCEIKEQEPGNGVWLSWIELRTIPPPDYIDATVGYDQMKLSVKCALKNGVEVPGLSEKPIPIEWDFTWLRSDVISQLGKHIDTDSITSPSDDADLIQAQIDPMEMRMATVRLDVDGYPRAFAFDVSLDATRTYRNEDRQRDLLAIRVISVAKAGHPKKYVTASRYLPAEPDEKNPVVVLRRRGGSPDVAAFPRAKRNDQLMLTLQVDAPVTTFGRDSRDVIQLKIDAPGFDPINLFTDRDSRFTIEELGADGHLSIHNIVSDYVEQQVPLPGIAGSFDLQTELRLERLDISRRHKVPLSFDDTPPRLITFDVPENIKVGSALNLHVVASDESGLERVEFGIVDDPADAPQKMTTVVLPRNRNLRLPFEKRLTLPTKDFESDKPYYVKLRILDRSGNELLTDGKRGAPSPQQFSMFEPVPLVSGDQGGNPDSAVVLPGTLTGAVKLGDYGPPRIKVELTGGKRFAPFETENGGKFEFKNVPPGDYVLKASGNPQNRGDHVGETPVSISKQEDFKQPVHISLEPKS